MTKVRVEKRSIGLQKEEHYLVSTIRTSLISASSTMHHRCDSNDMTVKARVNKGQTRATHLDLTASTLLPCAAFPLKTAESELVPPFCCVGGATAQPGISMIPFELYYRRRTWGIDTTWA